MKNPVTIIVTGFFAAIIVVCFQSSLGSLSFGEGRGLDLLKF